MAAPNLIPAEALAEARLDRQLRATVAMLGRDPDAVLAEERTAALIAAAAFAGRCAVVTIVADSDDDMRERAEQFRAPGVTIEPPLLVDGGDLGRWWTITAVTTIGGEHVAVTVRGPAVKP